MKGGGRILLAHGSGGRLTHRLIRERFLPRLGNPVLATLTDSGLLPELPPGRPALTTDAFVVDPVVFPGGDLGYLSVCGTVNDLAVAGARPVWLTWALILEEGCEEDLLDTIVAGTARAAAEAGVRIAAGDTKVVPSGKGDHLYAVTAGLGVVPPGRDTGDSRVEPGDALLTSGTLGDHGATIMACRHGLSGPGLRSDCAPVASLVEAAFESGAEIHAMHDPTRGGVAAVCNEVAGRAGARPVLEEAAPPIGPGADRRAGVRIVLDEKGLPIRPQVAATCELLGLDPLALASEGRVLFWVPEADAARLLRALRAHPLGGDAARIGFTERRGDGTAPVIMKTLAGGERPVDLLSGMDLPRIC